MVEEKKEGDKKRPGRATMLLEDVLKELAKEQNTPQTSTGTAPAPSPIPTPDPKAQQDPSAPRSTTAVDDLIKELQQDLASSAIKKD